MSSINNQTENGKSLVYVDYSGDHGTPAIRLHIQSPDHLRVLINAVKQLMIGEIIKISLDDLLPVKYSNIDSLCLELQPGSGWMRKSIFRLDSQDNCLRFLWITTRDGWYQNEGLLSGLLENTGYQYFSSSSADDAEIEINFNLKHNDGD
jgi:hypothetical protein